MTLGPIAFTAPWLLAALIALPLLWLLLRAIPPAPIRRRFPGVALLLGLKDDDTVTDRTPWWLLLLRMATVAALIVGLAGPVLNPSTKNGAGNGPLLVLFDASWASARDWSDRVALADRLLAEAGRAGRPVAVLRATAPEAAQFQSPSAWRSRLAGLAPNAWSPGPEIVQDLEIALTGVDEFETFWISDGLDRESRAGMLAMLEDRGPVEVFEGAAPTLALAPVRFVDGEVEVNALRTQTGLEQAVTVQAHGRDPAGTQRILAETELSFTAGEGSVEGTMDLPAELRGRLEWFGLKGIEGAGAMALTDDSLRRREVALISERENREGLELLSPLHYIEKALLPSAELIAGTVTDILPANPDVIVLADVAGLAPTEEEGLVTWIEEGGLLLRFAGPRLAASDVSRREEHPLMPVRLRAGGRTVGGAMSWGAPKSLAPFDKDSPFFGLAIPADVNVTAQVMAQPDPTLADRVIAQLDDGTPLVTRKKIGRGYVILFHVTANAEWSSLPLSGLFVSMLERLSVSTASATPSAEDLEGTLWNPIRVVTGLGNIVSGEDLVGVPGEDLAEAPLGPELQPGIYVSNDRTIARNVLRSDDQLAPATWPGQIRVSGFEGIPETPLGGWVLALALLLLLADILASLALTGRLRGPRVAVPALVLALTSATLVQPTQLRAQDDQRAVEATGEVVLAHVITGNRQIDDLAHAGLFGLSETLFFRTSVEPTEPMAVNLETDELSFFPLLYWPVTPDQQRPSAAAYEKLNRYIRSGGMILFDTRDADIAGYGASSPNGRKLQQLAAPLDIPALEPVPSDHVLTRTFYLLQDFPGRYASRDVWVEAAPADAERIEGMPFRNLNDNVTPVVIGGNDWAAAWAMDERGNPLLPVGRGLTGDRQRELAYRFGVNLVMHVLTGNYKSDQVHVPALLERLGQ